MKLNGTHQLLIHADDVNIFRGRVHNIKENAEALIVASKVTGLEVNADTTKYMVMSRDQNAGRSHNMRTDNRSFERAEEFKYLGTTITNENSIHEEIKSRLKTGNACFYLVQKLLSSRLLPKNLKIKIYRTNIKMDLQEVGKGCGDWMELAKDRDSWRTLVSTVMYFRVP